MSCCRGLLGLTKSSTFLRKKVKYMLSLFMASSPSVTRYSPVHSDRVLRNSSHQRRESGAMVDTAKDAKWTRALAAGVIRRVSITHFLTAS